MEYKNKVLQMMQSIAIGLAIVGIVLVVMFKITDNVKGDLTTDSLAYNAIADTEAAGAELPGWLAIFVVAAMGFGIVALIQRGRA